MVAQHVARNPVIAVDAAQVRHAPICTLGQLAAGGLGGAASGRDEVCLGVRIGMPGRPCGS